MEAEGFDDGAVVRLKSGGTHMTVEPLYAPMADPNVVACIWMDNHGILQRANIRREALEIVGPKAD